jgi:hypothetical protein
MSQRSLAQELNDAVGLLGMALIKLAQADVVLGRARDAASANGRHTEGYETLRLEIETLVGFVKDEVIATIQKMAEEEAGTRG